MTMRSIAAAALIICAALSVHAAEDADAAAKPNVENGKAKYKLFCVSCHGDTGKGDGIAAAALDPKPADHSDKKVMSALKDDYLFKVIKEGGAAVGKSPTMAPWGAALKDSDVKDVVAFIRTLAK